MNEAYLEDPTEAVVSALSPEWLELEDEEALDIFLSMTDSVILAGVLGTIGFGSKVMLKQISPLLHWSRECHFLKYTHEQVILILLSKRKTKKSRFSYLIVARVFVTLIKIHRGRLLIQYKQEHSF